MSDGLITGAVPYSQDVELEGMLHARIVRSPYPHARVLGVDVSRLAADCVALVPDDVREYGQYGPQIEDQTVLALDRALYAGDPVAAVAAPSRREAGEAMFNIDVDYEELPAVFDPLEAAQAGALLVHETTQVSGNDAAYFAMRPVAGTNICHRFRVRHGSDPEGLFDDCDVVVDRTYRTAGAQHAPLEPHAALARWDDGRLTVWTGTQTPFNLRDELAAIFHLQPEHVRIVCPVMGGAFGAKTFVRLEAIVAALAHKAGRPVKAVLERSELFQTLNRHPAVVRVKIGARADGTFVACRMWCHADTGAYADCGPGVVQKMAFAGPGPYRWEHAWVDGDCVYTNLPPNGAYRGYGQMQSTWARELAVDLVAEELGVDPLALRLKNVLQSGDRYVTGETMHDARFAECLEAAARAVDWKAGGRGQGLAVILKGMQTPSRAEIVIEAEEDDTYTLRCATAEMGQGARRAISILAADELGVDVSRIRFPDPDTDVAPYDTRTTSSRSTYAMGEALRDAVRDLRESGERRGHGRMSIPGGLDPDTGQGVASHHWHQGAAAAQVRVDEETGLVEVVRLHASIYAGRVVNPVAAELQNEGSMIMGLGTALFEEIEVVDGQVANANLSDYEIPAFADVPAAMTHDLIASEGGDVHGLGETALPPVPAAIGNALGSLGIHVTDLPMTAESVLHAVDDRATEKPL